MKTTDIPLTEAEARELRILLAQEINDTASLSEIAAVRGPGGLTIERDRHFTANKTLSEHATEARTAGSIKA